MAQLIEAHVSVKITIKKSRATFISCICIFQIELKFEHVHMRSSKYFDSNSLEKFHSNKKKLYTFDNISGYQHRRLVCIINLWQKQIEREIKRIKIIKRSILLFAYKLHLSSAIRLNVLSSPVSQTAATATDHLVQKKEAS